MKKEIMEDIGIKSISNIRVLNRYDVEGMTDKDYEKQNILFCRAPS